MNYLSLIDRQVELFDLDMAQNSETLAELVSKGRFLVIGGAGSIGQAVSKEIFKRNPVALHVVDISENNMVELVRDIGALKGTEAVILRHLQSTAGMLSLRRLWPMRDHMTTCLIFQP